nr:hypothetical protein [Nocardia donostiensis]
MSGAAGRVGGEPGTDLEELVDTRVLGEVAQGAFLESAARDKGVSPAGSDLADAVADGAVGVVVVFPAEGGVVDAGDAGPRVVDSDGFVGAGFRRGFCHRGAAP